MVIDIALGYVDGDGVAIYKEWQVPKGTTLIQALSNSVFATHPDFGEFSRWAVANIDQKPSAKDWYVGIFGQKKRLDTALCCGDRIEIYRPLINDPTHRRKLVANQ